RGKACVQIFVVDLAISGFSLLAQVANRTDFAHVLYEAILPVRPGNDVDAGLDELVFSPRQNHVYFGTASQQLLDEYQVGATGAGANGKACIHGLYAFADQSAHLRFLIGGKPAY